MLQSSHTMMFQRCTPQRFSFPSHHNRCAPAPRPCPSLHHHPSTFDDQLAVGRSVADERGKHQHYSIHFEVADCYPNVSIAYRVLLIIPVTLASAKRSFSKLKLLRNYLRSNISHERLNGLLCAPLRRTFRMILILILLLKTTYFHKALKHYILFEIIVNL
jgi:hypothetical protein